MSNNTNIQESCDQIIHSVRTANLNFAYQETPFSIYITVRKTVTKLQQGQQSLPSNRTAAADDLTKALEEENTALKTKLKDL